MKLNMILTWHICFIVCRKKERFSYFIAYHIQISSGKRPSNYSIITDCHSSEKMSGQNLKVISNLQMKYVSFQSLKECCWNLEMHKHTLKVFYRRNKVNEGNKIN